jgi:hypothetical protein
LFRKHLLKKNLIDPNFHCVLYNQSGEPDPDTCNIHHPLRIEGSGGFKFVQISWNSTHSITQLLLYLNATIFQDFDSNCERWELYPGITHVPFFGKTYDLNSLEILLHDILNSPDTPLTLKLYLNDLGLVEDLVLHTYVCFTYERCFFKFKD